MGKVPLATWHRSLTSTVAAKAGPVRADVAFDRIPADTSGNYDTCRKRLVSEVPGVAKQSRDRPPLAAESPRPTGTSVGAQLGCDGRVGFGGEAAVDLDIPWMMPRCSTKLQ